MFKVIHCLKWMCLFLLLVSSSGYAISKEQAIGSGSYSGSVDAKVNVSLTRKDSAVIVLLLRKAAEFKRLNRADQAAVIWERVLKSDPTNQDALAELAFYRFHSRDFNSSYKLLGNLTQVNRSHPAVSELEMLLKSVGQGGDAAKAEARQRQEVMQRERELMHQADMLDEQGKYTAASELYRKVQWLNPMNPWATFGLARSLLRLGNEQVANDEIAKIDGNLPESNLALALFYAESKSWEKALTYSNKVTKVDRETDLPLLKSRINLNLALSKANALVGANKIVEANLIFEEIQKTITGSKHLFDEFSARLCDGWRGAKESERAIRFLDEHEPLNEAAQVYLMGLLLEVNQDKRALKQLDTLFKAESKYKFSAEQKTQLEKMRVVLALRQVDKLIEAYNPDAAYELLEPLQAKYPKDVSVMDRKSRIDMLSIYLAIAEIDQLLLDDNIEEAQTYVDVKLERFHNASGLLDARKRIENVRVERIDRGIETSNELLDNGKVYEAEHLLQKLLQRFPGRPAIVAELERMKVLVAKEDAKYKSQAEQDAARKQAIKIADIEAVEKLNAENLDEVKAERKLSYVEVGYSFMQKSGDAGLNKLIERDIPVAWHIPLALRSTEILVKASDVSLDAGDVSALIDRYGYGAAVRNGTYIPPAGYPVTARGQSLSVAYIAPGMAIDFGTSPAGFITQNWVGGLRLETDFRSNSLSLEVNRRSVTDSVISFAGAMEPYGAGVWGGVAKTGIQGAVYRRLGDNFAVYASYGEYDFTGLNVADNHSGNLNSSLIYDLHNYETGYMTLALALSQARYDNNQNIYTWGNGGYYSPQNAVAVNLPWHWTGKTGKLSYEVNVSVGRSQTLEKSAMTYPTESLWQNHFGSPQVETTTYSTNFGYDWTVEYKLSPEYFIGNSVKVSSNDATYHQSSTMVYLRVDLDHSSPKVVYPPKPIKPYYQTTQGGAGHN